MSAYSIPYLILLLIFGSLSVYAHKNKDSYSQWKGMVVACSLILLLFFGFRGYIGNDWTSYVPIFEHASIDTINFNVFVDPDDVTLVEPGFVLLMVLCKDISDSYVFFQFVCTLLNVLLLYQFLKNRVANYPLTIILFLIFGGYVMMTNLMRNSISLLIALNALVYLEQRQPLQYFALCLIAIHFHISAIFFIPMYFLLNLNINKWWFLGIMIVANLFFLMQFKITSIVSNSILEESFGRMAALGRRYSETEEYAVTKTISIGYIERVFTIILVFIHYDKLKSLRNNSYIYINGLLFFMCTMFFLSELSVMAERTANLFAFSYWIIWADMIYILSNNIKKSYIAFLVVYCSLKMIGFTSLPTSEYDNHLFGAKSYQERLLNYNKETYTIDL